MTGMLHGLSLSGRIFQTIWRIKPYIQRQQILNWTLEGYTWGRLGTLHALLLCGGGTGR